MVSAWTRDPLTYWWEKNNKILKERVQTNH